VSTFEHVLVPLRLHSSDGDLLRYARQIAALERGRTRFTFLHVLSPPDLAAFRRAPGRSRLEAMTTMKAAIDEDFGDEFERQLIVRSGDGIDQILELGAEVDCDLVLVGHRRSARGRRTIARRVAMQSPVSLWMVPEGALPAIRRVVVGTDFSLPSSSAVARAAWIAARSDLPSCTAMYVRGGPEEALELADPTSLDRVFAQFLAPIDLHGIAFDRLSIEGESVAKTVLADAAPGDLIVMGTRGGGTSAATLLGTETEHVLLDADVPVLVTRHRDDPVGIASVPRHREDRWPEVVKFG